MQTLIQCISVFLQFCKIIDDKSYEILGYQILISLDNSEGK